MDYYSMQDPADKSKAEKYRVFISLVFPFFFLLFLWIIKLTEIVFSLNFIWLGVFPRTLHGLIGIITSPLIHGSIEHLVANSAPLLILSAGIFYFYRPIAMKVFLLIYFIAGFWLWFLGRESYHVGASGLIYGFSAFLFLSGILRRHTGLMALSLLVTFLYGGMVWGVFPIQEQISWEGHLTGMLAGFVLAVFFRKEGPQRKRYEWELEEEEEEETEDDDSYSGKDNFHPHITYHYRRGGSNHSPDS